MSAVVYMLLVESGPTGLMLLMCPNGARSIDCNEVKCCPPENTTCCPDESSLKNAIPVGCASIFPRGHPLGCPEKYY